MPKVSIIVPVHNAGKYLIPCIESCINQTFQDIEIFLIDDGSTDGSRQIIKDYEARDNRITAICRRKGEYEKFGQKYSVDLGRLLMKGEYFIMIDHDDELIPTGIETLYKETENGTIDVVQGQNISFDENGTLVYTPTYIWPIKRVIRDFNKINTAELSAHLVGTPIALWTCLIRSEMAKDLELADCIFNDASFIWQLKIAAKTFAYIPDIVYQQHHHDDSTSGPVHAYDGTSFNTFLSFNHLEKFLKQRGVSEQIWRYYTMYKLRILSCHVFSKNHESDEYKKCLERLKIEMAHELDVSNDVEKVFLPELAEEYKNICQMLKI